MEVEERTDSGARDESGLSSNMNSRVTLRDVAEAAGVSTATVDRVLNARDGVRDRTREVVLEVAQRLGYVGEAEPSKPVSAIARARLVFLFPAGTNTFIRHLKEQIEQQAEGRADLTARVESLEGFNPQSIASRLLELQGEADGFGVIAQDHPLVREAIRTLTAAGTPVVTIASDIQNVPRIAYVGVDNRQAGRLAGYLLGRLLGNRSGAKVALFAGSFSYRGHEEREMGFRHILRDEFPNLRIVETRETFDDRTRALDETRALLKKHPDIAGIYNVGAGVWGIGEALREDQPDRKVVLVGHEVTEATKLLLLEGTMDAAIDQNPRVEAREALNVLAAAVAGRSYRFIPPRIQVVFKENLPDE